MKSKQNAKKKGDSSTNLGPPGTPDNLKSTSTPNPSPSGSTSSTGSSHQAAAVNVRPGGPDQSGGGAAGGSTAGGGGSTVKSVNAKSKGASSSKDTDKAIASGSLQKSSSYPSLGPVTHFELGSFPKINGLLTGNKAGPGAGGGQPTQGNGVAAVAAAPTATPTPVAGAAGGVVVPEGNKAIENLSMDDVDMLQTELETLWSSVAVRIRTMNQEIGGLQTAGSHHHNQALEHFDPQHQEKIAAVATFIDHGTRTSVSAAAKLVMGAQLGASNSPLPSPSTSASVAATPTPKKSGTVKGERQPKKKLKGEGGGLGKSSKKGGDKPAARATQNRSHSVSSDVGSDGVLKQHEVPNQFWDSTEQYFPEVTTDNLDNLQKLIDKHNDFPKDLMDIPPLGKHYKDDEETIKKKAKERQASSGKDQVGAMTQRLVGALVDERVNMYKSNQLNSPKEDASTGGAASSSSNPDGGFIHRQGLARALGLDGSGPAVPGPSSGGSNSGSALLESRIRDCLLENALLSAEDANDPLLMNPDDEILAEIKRTQNTLKKLHNYNSEVFQRFLAIGKREYERQAYKKELDKADKEVLEAYKAISQLRLKKKPVTKKDKDAAFKALENRKKALQRLEAQDKKYGQYSGAGPSSSSAAASSDPTAALRVQV